MYGEDREKYYECHVTVMCQDGLWVCGEGHARMSLIETVESHGDGEWKFSRIDGDPGVKCYATARYGLELGIAGVRFRVGGMAKALAAGGYRVVRQKIELVVWDFVEEH